MKLNFATLLLSSSLCIYSATAFSETDDSSRSPSAECPRGPSMTTCAGTFAQPGVLPLEKTKFSVRGTASLIFNTAFGLCDTCTSPRTALCALLSVSHVTRAFVMASPRRTASTQFSARDSGFISVGTRRASQDTEQRNTWKIGLNGSYRLLWCWVSCSTFLKFCVWRRPIRPS